MASGDSRAAQTKQKCRSVINNLDDLLRRHYGSLFELHQLARLDDAGLALEFWLEDIDSYNYTERHTQVWTVLAKAFDQCDGDAVANIDHALTVYGSAVNFLTTQRVLEAVESLSEKLKSIKAATSILLEDSISLESYERHAGIHVEQATWSTGVTQAVTSPTTISTHMSDTEPTSREHVGRIEVAASAHTSEISAEPYKSNIVLGEVVGLTACVAGIVSAYRDGRAVLAKVKQRRSDDRQPTPPWPLEQALSEAPNDISNERDRGVARFGVKFEQGDHIAVIALQAITIQLQGSLLEKLRNSYIDTAIDFMPLLDAADGGRDDTIRCLLDLRQRLLTTAPISEVHGQVPAEVPQDRSSRDVDRKPKSSLLDGLQKRSHRTRKKTSALKADRSSSTSKHPVASTSYADGQDAIPSSQYENWEDDPVQMMGFSPATRVTDRNPAISASSFAQTWLMEPTPENNFLGFCRSAWRLQNGDRKAMQRSASAILITVHPLKCSNPKCAFAGHLNIDLIWSQVFDVSRLGLKFRWPFLAKSHVPQEKIKDHRYAYQCIICVLAGDRSLTYSGDDAYLEHVATHRGQLLSEVVLYKTKCIAGRVAEALEDFDINLFPLTPGERQSTMTSIELLEIGALGIGTKESSAGEAVLGQASTFSKGPMPREEPYNAPLSTTSTEPMPRDQRFDEPLPMGRQTSMSRDELSDEPLSPIGSDDSWEESDTG